MQKAYRGRNPSAPMEAAALLQVVDRLEEHGIDVWLDGGWGVDACSAARPVSTTISISSPSVDGKPVRCLSPEVQVLVHAGYELTEKDYRELYLLRERFGVEPPEDLLERLLAAGPGV